MRLCSGFVVLVFLFCIASCATPVRPSVSPRAGIETSGLAVSEGRDAVEPCDCELPSTLEITCIDAGQADATLIASPTRLMLVDCGERSWNSHAVADKVDAVIKAKYGSNCRQLDYMLVTHMHLDHIGNAGFGGVWYLVNNKGYTIKEKTILRDYENNVGTATDTYDNWNTYLASPEGIAKLKPATAIIGADQIDLGSAGNKIIGLEIVAVDGRTESHPNGTRPEILGDHRNDPFPPSENDYCVSFLLTSGEFQMFFGGDLDGEDNVREGLDYAYHDIESFVAFEAGDIEVLRVNHHGSIHSTNQLFLDFLRPEVSIISVGPNGYGHPSQDVLKRLDSSGTDIYMTGRGNPSRNIYDASVCDEDIDIVVNPNGLTYTVEGNQYSAAAPQRAPIVGEDILPTCTDRLDNDGDGYVDEDDTDCDNVLGQGGEDIFARCTDGVDNDDDGYMDNDDSDCGEFY